MQRLLASAGLGPRLFLTPPVLISCLQAVVWLLALLALVANVYLIVTFVSDPDQVRLPFS